MLKSTILILFALVYVTTFAQKEDSIKFNNRKYKQEIGIDFQGLFAGRPGSALIWKVRYDKDNLVSVSYASYFRYQIAVSGNMQLDSKEQIIDNDWTPGISDHIKNASNLSIQPMIGKERVEFFGKFNFFYGVDFGLFYRYTDDGYQFYTNSNDSTSYYYGGSVGGGITKQFGALVIPFIGMKYHFTEQFSITLES
jgi:hypothetical protein